MGREMVLGRCVWEGDVLGEGDRFGDGDGLHDDSKCGPGTTEKGLLPGGFFMTSDRHKINFRWSPPGSRWGAYDASPDPLVRWEEGRPFPYPHPTAPRFWLSMDVKWHPGNAKCVTEILGKGGGGKLRKLGAAQSLNLVIDSQENN